MFNNNKNGKKASQLVFKIQQKNYAKFKAFG
jgi:hypothetical protein